MRKKRLNQLTREELVEELARVSMEAIVATDAGVHPHAAWSPVGQVARTLLWLEQEAAKEAAITPAQKAVTEQKEWMQQCGVDLAGYILTYGSKDSPDFAKWPIEGYAGSGGEAIYAADAAELAKREEEAANG